MIRDNGKDYQKIDRPMWDELRDLPSVFTRK